MTKIAGVLGMITVAVALSPVAIQAERNRPLKLPAEFAGYKQWTPLLKSPHQVPTELWLLCRAPTPSELDAAREKNGPHAGRFIRVYGNQSAVAAVSDRERKPLPPGAVIAKEKLSGSLQGVAFMVKRKASQFPETDGWEFLFYPASGDGRRTHEACASCHQSAASKDYVFGQYPR